jgi:hypothetical protein
MAPIDALKMDGAACRMRCELREDRRQERGKFGI